jgi:lipoate-protein ligase A
VHAEYKVPGGKLVVVDLEVDQGRISACRVAGDFFLEPDEALEDINRAIVGLSASASGDDIAHAVRGGLAPDVVMMGFSPEAVGTVVRRALTGATGFRDYRWEYIAPAALEPLQQMALDQILAEEVGAGRRAPTLRFWEWAKPAVVIGSFQSFKNEVDLDNAQKYGMEVVRRVSGGGAMFMELGTAITYSLYAPAELVSGMSFQDSYAFLDDWVIRSLRGLGIDARYQPLNDIASPEGKIGGAAQKRLGSGAVLHHVTMSYDMDGDRMVEVLRIGREKISDKGVSSANKRVDPLKAHTGLTKSALEHHLVVTFRELYGLAEGEITPEEMKRANALVEEKFATPEWLYRVP